MKRKLKPHKRTPEEEAAWKHWAETGEGAPPGWTTLEPNPGEHKLIVSVKPKQAKTKEDLEYEEAAKILGNGFTAQDARMIHELFTGR